MKKIIILVTLAMAWAGAEAQDRYTIAPKHQKMIRKANAENVNSCKLIPKDVCTISADRRSVTCYKTIDGKDFKQYGTQTTHYGPTGDVPGGKKAKFETETIVVTSNKNGDFCNRDHAARATTCYIKGHGICRDENGYYSYCNVAEGKNKIAKSKKHKKTPRYATNVTSPYASTNNVVLK